MASRQPERRPATGRLAGLIGALRAAGLDPDKSGLADALWLAQHARPPAPPGLAGEQGPAGGQEYPEPPGGASGRTAASLGEAEGRPTGGEDSGRSGGPRSVRTPHPGDQTVALYADPADSGQLGSGIPADALRVGVPEARALPGLLELERALRPLQRYRPPARPPGTWAGELDERATVEATAQSGGLLLPAFHELTRGHIELQLLMDATSAMRVWQRMLAELTEVFARLGAFRDIQVHYLHESPDGTPAISRRLDQPAAAALHPVRQLMDPTGRRLSVVVSDCAGPLWRSGAAHRVLARLARHAQVAVVQPLPQRLWARTRMPVSYGTLTRDEGPAGSARLRFTSDDPHQPYGGTGARGVAAPVPVLPPTAAALGAWAGLLAGPGAGAVRAAVGWVRPDQPAAPSTRRSRVTPRTAAELLARFRATASPSAGQLAVYLAAAPLFLPVMQLVQRTMLPDSGPAELAEVMLGGLLRRREEPPGSSGPAGDGRWYEFVDGAHEELLRALGHDEALLVLKHCSTYVEQRFGKVGPNFPALALAQLTGGAADDPRLPGVQSPAGPDVGPGEPTPPGRPVPQPFAEVAAKVLQRFLPELPPEEAPVSLTRGAAERPAAAAEAVTRARSLADQFAEDGHVRHLVEAVRLLRDSVSGHRASGRGTDPELWSELAALLLRLWRAQHGNELLREARQAAETAAAHPGSVRARTVLARVLTAQAAEQRAVGDDRGALALWRLADREFAAVCATPGLGAREALGPALERVQVLEEQWRLGGDSGLLQESVGMLEAITDAWPGGEPVPSELPLARGRALLRLVEAEPDAERAEANAEQAAASLELGCESLRAESAPPRTLARALLEQADALLLTGRDWPRAEPILAQARELSDDPALHGDCLIRAGRLHTRRFADDGTPEDLAAAAQRFAGAGRLVSRDRPEYSQLLQEWGAALLTRAGLPGGAEFVSQAVRVLRDCRMETPFGDPRLSARLLMLGRALTARYRQLGELVDLREAEYLFGLAANSAQDSLTRAWAWFEEGEAHRRTHRHTRRPERLDLAAESYRRTASAALQAETSEPGGRPPGPDPVEAIRLAAAAHLQRGVVYEAAHRPLAAAESYRQSVRHARRLPKGDAGEETAERAEERLSALSHDHRPS